MTDPSLPSTEAVGEVRRRCTCAPYMVDLDGHTHLCPVTLDDEGWLDPLAAERLFEQRDTAIRERDEAQAENEAAYLRGVDDGSAGGWWDAATRAAVEVGELEAADAHPQFIAGAQHIVDDLKETDHSAEGYRKFREDIARMAVEEYRHAVRADRPSMYEDRLAELKRERDQARADLKAFGGEVARLYEVEREAERMRKVVEAARVITESGDMPTTLMWVALAEAVDTYTTKEAAP